MKLLALAVAFVGAGFLAAFWVLLAMCAPPAYVSLAALISIGWTIVCAVCLAMFYMRLLKQVPYEDTEELGSRR